MTPLTSEEHTDTAYAEKNRVKGAIATLFKRAEMRKLAPAKHQARPILLQEPETNRSWRPEGPHSFLQVP